MIVKNVYLKLNQLIVFIVLLNGLLVAVLKYINIILPFSIIAICIILMTPILALQFLKKYIYDESVKTISIYFGFISIYLLFKLFFDLNSISSQSVNLTIISILSLFFFYLPIGLNYKDSMKLINFMRIVGFILLFIAYMQLFLHNQLPSAFVELPKIDSAMVGKDYIRELADLVIFRPNGLFANPITFGSLLLLFYSIELFNFFQTKKKIYLLTTFLFFFMIFSLYSRANIAGTLVILFLLLNQYGYIKKYFFSIAFILLFFIIIFMSLYQEIPQLKFIVDRFTGADVLAQASSEEHLHDYINALTYIANNPFGLTIGQNQNLNIITDGSWFIFLLNYGIPLFVVYLTLWFVILKNIYLLNKNQPYIGFLLPYFLLISFSAFVNSYMLEKKIFVFLWFLIGILYNLRILSLKENRHA